MNARETVCLIRRCLNWLLKKRQSNRHAGLGLMQGIGLSVSAACFIKALQEAPIIAILSGSQEIKAIASADFAEEALLMRW